MQRNNEQGIALLTTLLVMMLMSALLVGFTAVVMSDQRYRFIDRDRNQAFYAANGGIEKLTADLGNLFLGNVAPTVPQLTALVTYPNVPVIDNVTFAAPLAPETLPTSSLMKCPSPATIATVGSAGYTLKYCAGVGGVPTTTPPGTIKSGPYEGLVAQQLPFQMDVSAKTRTGGEVHLVRTMEAVAIPVFQFGMFSDVDLSFFAGPNFGFGGRVHTNGNLFLSQGSGATLTLSDKVTAVKEIIRERMQNNVSIDTAPAHAGTVNMAKAPGVFQALLRTQGSLVDGIGSAQNEPTWHTTSLSTYNSWIRNGRTGAKPLNLALINVGGTNPDMIRRPPVDEDIDNPVLLSERLFTKASLRILLSDVATDITDMPGVTNTPPVQLDGNWRAAPPNNGIGVYGPIDTAHQPIARSPGLVTAQVNPAVLASIPPAFRSITLTAGSAAVTTGYFRSVATPQFTVTNGATTIVVSCTSKNATQFTGCIPTTGIATPATITANAPTIDGDFPSATVTAWAAGSGAITVGPGPTSTMGFAPNSLWLGNNLITCSGYNSNSVLTGCNVPVGIGLADVLTTSAHATAGTGTIGGFIKIERQATDGTWNDVTMEILNWGISDPNLVLGAAGVNAGGTACAAVGAAPFGTAIVKLQRLKSNNFATCPTYGNMSTDYWPNTLFDTREAVMRDVAPGGGGLPHGGVMHYISLDVQNLVQWFRGIGAYGASTGVNSKLDNGGYTVYFSDRRNNRNALSQETGEYGFEDVVNPAVGSGAPNGTLDAGEDLNASATLDVYGGRPSYNGVYNTVFPQVAPALPFTAAATPLTQLTRVQAMVNRAIFFRRALKLVRGNSIQANGVTGLSIVSENPVYVQGDWNAQGGNFTGAHAATAVMADSVTLLSNAWSDNTSFAQPYTVGARNRGTQTWYRMAIISGKGPSFPQPAGTATDFGTDGGAHNFLHYLENGDQPVNYRGSIATFFYNRQAVGTYKCCATVYGAPARNYTFDTDFLTPALLPPNTPMFRDLNTVGFAQEMRPGR